jgi:hypothetical protein
LSLEQKEIRPFATIAELNTFFEEMRLIVGEHLVMPDSALILEEDIYLRNGVNLQLANDKRRLKQLINTLIGGSGANPFDPIGLTVNDLEFVVVGRTSFLRIVDIIDRRPLAELANGPVLLDIGGSPRRDFLRSPNSGCEITAMVCLAETRPKMPLRPWRAGTWLSKTTFTLSTTNNFTGFTPKPMDSDRKRELKLPTSAVRYITMGNVSPLDEAANENSLEMFVDVDLLALMSAMPRSVESKALQQQLFVDSIAAVTRAARDNVSEDVPKLTECSWADIENTLMGTIITALAPKSSDAAIQARSCADLLDVLRDDPARFVARAEALSGLLGSLESLLED